MYSNVNEVNIVDYLFEDILSDDNTVPLILIILMSKIIYSP